MRFHESTVRATGRASRGVTGIRLAEGDELCGVVIVSEIESMVLISQRGFGKRVEYANFSPHGRGTRGQTCYRSSEATGEIVGALSVDKRDDLVCISSQGNLIKLRLREIPVQGKAARGVRVVNLDVPDVVVGIAKSEREDETKPDGEPTPPAAASADPDPPHPEGEDSPET